MGSTVAEDRDWCLNSLLRETSEQFDEHSKRVEAILDAACEKFEKDFTGMTAATGTVIALAALGLAVLDRATVVAAVGLITGVVLLLAALVARQRSGEGQLKHARTILELEKERATFAQKSAVLRELWLHGPPQGASLAEIQLFLVEHKLLTDGLEEARAVRKALPAESNLGQTERMDSE
jgi:hypothetical protein